MAQDANPGVIAPSQATASLILDFLESLSSGPRACLKVMEAWRTSCPRLRVWEDAMDSGWVRREPAGCEAVVTLTRWKRGI